MNPIRIFYPHIRRNLVAYLALFAALGTGTAYAAGKVTGKDIAANAIRAKHIKDGQVRGAELATSAVTAAKVADDSLTGADIDESTLRLPAPASTPAPRPPTPKEPDLSGFARVVAQGYLTGPGPLKPADRCNSVGTEAPGVGPADQVVVTPGSLTEEVVYSAAVTSPDHIAYQACYTGSGEVFIGADVSYMVLRAQE
jgi:hypothetical protein